MMTVDRVERFANDKLKSIFISMDLESFQQEYECHHIDETVAFFPLSLINKCVFNFGDEQIFFEEDENAEDYKPTMMEAHYPRVKFSFDDSIEAVYEKCRSGIIRGDIYAGFDVGRRRHGAELIITEDAPSGPIVVRGRIQFRNTEFELMEAELKKCVDVLRVMKMHIDETGPGIQLAENMSKLYPGICIPVTFTAPWKESGVSHIRRLLESWNLAIPDDRDVKGQIHSIKRQVSDHGNLRFDAEKNKEHHGDILWGIVLAVSELRQSEPSQISASSGEELPSEFRRNIIERPIKRLFVPTAPMSRIITTFPSINPR